MSDSQTPPAGAPRRGMQAVTGDDFHLSEALGGVRGVIETGAPGLVFIAVWTFTRNLTASLIAACAVAVVALVARLIQRQPLTQAASGILGIALGVFLAWQARDAGAEDAQAAVRFFLPGLLTNAAYFIGTLLSNLIKWPFVGLIIEMLRLGLGEQKAEKARKAGDPDAPPESPNPFKGFANWRHDPELLRRYILATWVWVAGFALRLAVQVPLYLAGEAGALGVARLILGTPLWGLILWLTWAIVRGAHKSSNVVEDDEGSADV